MSNQDQVDELVLELLDSGRTPEEICRDCPELLAEVRKTWLRVRAIDAEFSSILPGSNGVCETVIPFGGELPQIPGYEMQRVLGRGGVAIVYLAHHVKLGRSVAVKMLLAGSLAKTRELERFSRETKTLAELNHPNIIQIFDVGDYNGCPYFTMEYLNGGTLSDRVKERPMPAQDAARLIATLAETIHIAHQSEVIHRDLTPSNILFTTDGVPKITDFGLARHLHGDTEGLTITGAALGTPGYMAPEQADGRGTKSGPAKDVYALGAILYKLLAGRPPFQAETTASTIRHLLFDDPVPPAKLNPSVPRDLETICLKCLSKETQKRYESAAALADDVRRFERGEPIRARPIGHLGRAVRWARRRPALAMALATGMMLALALVVTILWWHGQQTALAAAAMAYAEADLSESERLLEKGEFNASAEVLERARDRLREFVPPELEERLSTAFDNLGLVKRLDDIRLRRSVRFNETHTFDRAQSDRDYEEAFRSAGLGTDKEMAETVAARVRDALSGKVLVAALDDWASCTADPRRCSWVLKVARLADPDPWRDRARDAEVWGNRTKLKELTDAAPVKQQPLTLLLAVGEQLQLAGGDSRPFLWRVQQQHPDDFWANRALGDALYLRGEHDLSIGFFRMALALRPDTAVANNELGDVLTCTGRADEATFYLERALEIDPMSARNHLCLGDALTVNGKPDEADRHYREAMRLVPETTLGRRSVAIGLERSRREDDARALYEQNVRLNPRNEQCRRDLAMHLARRGQLNEAAAQFQAALDIDPKSLMAHADLGRLLLDMRRPDEAATHFRAALAINPKSVMALHDMGSLLLRTGRPREAVDYLRQGADLEPFNGLIQADLRAALIGQGRLEEARAAWRKALDAGPPEHDAWFGYAELCLFLKDKTEYRRARSELLAHFGSATDPSVAERVARACLLLPPSQGELREAVALVERAVSVGRAGHESAYPYYVFAQGLARYRQGRFDDAAKLMNGEAASVMGPSPRFILAMARYQKGEKDQAREMLREAIASHDWDLAKATNHDAWISHILRREAEALISKDLPASRDDK